MTIDGLNSWQTLWHNRLHPQGVDEWLARLADDSLALASRFAAADLIMWQLGDMDYDALRSMSNAVYDIQLSTHNRRVAKACERLDMRIQRKLDEIERTGRAHLRYEQSLKHRPVAA